MSPKNEGAAERPRRAYQRIGEAVLIAALCTALSVFASVWATNHLTSANEDRQYLLANDARTRAKDVLADASKSRTKRPLELSLVLDGARTAIVNGDVNLSKKDYDAARRSYENALLTLERTCQGTGQDFCYELRLYDVARGIAKDIR